MNITHLNDLYTQLEYETDKDMIQDIKHEIKQLEHELDTRCPYCTKRITKKELKVFGMCQECYDNNVE